MTTPEKETIVFERYENVIEYYEVNEQHLDAMKFGREYLELKDLDSRIRLIKTHEDFQMGRIRK